jgi:hypothetical protein
VVGAYEGDYGCPGDALLIDDQAWHHLTASTCGGEAQYPLKDIVHYSRLLHHIWSHRNPHPVPVPRGQYTSFARDVENFGG